MSARRLCKGTLPHLLKSFPVLDRREPLEWASPSVEGDFLHQRPQPQGSTSHAPTHEFAARYQKSLMSMRRASFLLFRNECVIWNQIPRQYEPQTVKSVDPDPDQRPCIEPLPVSPAPQRLPTYDTHEHPHLVIETVQLGDFVVSAEESKKSHGPSPCLIIIVMRVNVPGKPRSGKSENRCSSHSATTSFHCLNLR